MIRVALLFVFLTLTSCSTVEPNPASLASIRHQQSQNLFESCMRYQYDLKAQIVYRIEDLSNRCNEWVTSQLESQAFY